MLQYILKVRIGIRELVSVTVYPIGEGWNKRAGQCREPKDENYILMVRIGIRELVSVESRRMIILS